MSKEIEKTTGEGIKKNPYTLGKLAGRWVMAIFLILIGLPILAEILGFFLGFPQSLIAPWFMMAYSVYIISWTIKFLLKRKRFTKKERHQNNKNNCDNSKK